MPAYFNVGAFRDTPSWHGEEVNSGGIFTGDVNIWEIMQSAGMDYVVEKNPIGVTMSDGSFLPDGDRWAIMRPPTAFDSNWKNLRVVGNRYEPIQNEQLAHILEPLNRNGWPLEGTAVLKDGMVIFIELKLNEFYVANKSLEKHVSYLLVSNDHSQGSAFWGLTHVRVFCNNTYTMALAGEGIENLPHTKDTEIEMDFRVKLQLAVKKQEERSQKFLNRLFARKVEEEETENFFETVFSNPAPTRKMRLAQEGKGIKKHDFLDLADDDITNFNRRVERAEKLRGELRSAFGAFNEEFPYAANTAYALLNATTWVTNHSESFTGNTEKNLVSLFFGQKHNFNQLALAELDSMVRNDS